MNIPPHATKVHQGIVYDVYNWEQKLFDGTTKTFEGLKRRPAVQIFATTPEGMVLLKEEQPGQQPYLSLPGGNVDSDDVLACAKRELLEETGLTSETWILWKKIPLGLSIEFDTYYYIAKNCKKLQEQSLDKGGERISIEHLPLKEFLQTLKDGHVRNEILQAMATTLYHEDHKFQEFSQLLDT
ncbi:MAG TPA: NUDIX hydrolase [Candidatus Nanoarchaeia archaeon]|nr:NUDIX hydrolase [Candidatus Nanoarchaeia archaeon]